MLPLFMCDVLSDGAFSDHHLLAVIGVWLGMKRRKPNKAQMKLPVSSSFRILRYSQLNPSALDECPTHQQQ